MGQFAKSSKLITHKLEFVIKKIYYKNKIKESNRFENCTYTGNEF